MTGNTGINSAGYPAGDPQEHSKRADSEETALVSSALDNLVEAITVIDKDCKFIYANQAARKLLSINSTELSSLLCYKRLHGRNAPCEEFDYLCPKKRLSESGQSLTVIHEHYLPSGEARFFEIVAAPLRSKDGIFQGIVESLRDITERRQAEQALFKSEKKLKDITSSLAEGIYVLDKDGNVTFMNPEAERLLGWTIDELNEKGPHDLIHFRRADGTPLPLEECNMQKVIKTGKRFSSTDEVFVRKDGSVFPVSVISAPIIENDRVIASVTAFSDITELKRAEKEITHMAHHDALTGLPNRRLFTDIIRIECAQARRHRTKIALLFLDLDRFKEVNDTLGHEIGDALLREVSVRLRSTVRESDTISRIGGDEFNIILSDLAHVEDVTDVARKIVESFRKPFSIAGHELHSTTSIGISIYPDDSEDINTLFRYADIALYYIKEHGKNAFQFYNPAINTRSLERMRLESMLRQAINRGELEVYYQPQVRIDTGEIVCAEALLRWRHPEQGLLEPGHFIKLAEETGLITPINEWVMKTACAQAKTWQKAGLAPCCVTVNLSARCLKRPDEIEIISRILSETGLPPDLLDIEITEDAAMGNIEHTIPFFTKVAEMGVGISIDDFGTGYSSLNHLKRLPIQKLKIDKSFINDITTDMADLEIVKAVIAMAHNLKIKVVAEGVKDKEQLSLLKENGCDEVQGYIFSAPLPAEEFRTLWGRT